MIKLEDIRKGYEDASATLSSLNRQLCFAGFAIIWIFNGSVNGFKIPQELFVPGFLLCLSLFIDVLQYVFTTVAWYWYYLKKRQLHRSCGESVAEIDEPECMNIPSWFLFFLKIGCMMAGYILIGLFLISKF